MGNEKQKRPWWPLRTHGTPPSVARSLGIGECVRHRDAEVLRITVGGVLPTADVATGFGPLQVEATHHVSNVDETRSVFQFFLELFGHLPVVVVEAACAYVDLVSRLAEVVAHCPEEQPIMEGGLAGDDDNFRGFHFTSPLG